MARPRTPIGTFGRIAFAATPSGRVGAHTRYRDWDGVLRRVQAVGESRAAAERALKAKLTERSLVAPSFTTISADSTFAELVEYWLEDLALEGHLATSTRETYEWYMRNVVLPAFAELTLREIGVARCDRFLKHLATDSYNRARQAKAVMRLAFGLAVRHEVLPRNPMDHVARLRRPPTSPTALTPAEVNVATDSYNRARQAKAVMRLAFGLAVRHEVLPRNPMDHVARLRRPPTSPTALTPAEVNAVRAAITHWERGLSTSGPRPDGQLGLMVEVMLGTSARIGEVLAIRRCDIDVAGAPPTIRIAGTVVRHRGQPLARQDHPKTSRSRRLVALPTFAAAAVRRRLTVRGAADPDGLLFCTRTGTPLSPHNVRRQLRQAMAVAGIEGVTPHMLRRSVATAVHRQASVDLAAELLGHTDPKVTIQHYIRRSEMVNPLTAEVLDQVFSPTDP